MTPPAKNVRGLIERTQTDLRRAENTELYHPGVFETQGQCEYGICPERGEEITRYETAEEDLADFGTTLGNSYMGDSYIASARVDEAINDVRNVLDYNALDRLDWDALTNDLWDLRTLRVNGL